MSGEKITLGYTIIVSALYVAGLAAALPLLHEGANAVVVFDRFFTVFAIPAGFVILIQLFLLKKHAPGFREAVQSDELIMRVRYRNIATAFAILYCGVFGSLIVTPLEPYRMDIIVASAIITLGWMLGATLLFHLRNWRMDRLAR